MLIACVKICFHVTGWTDPLVQSRNKWSINHSSSTIDHQSSVCAGPLSSVFKALNACTMLMFQPFIFCNCCIFVFFHFFSVTKEFKFIVIVLSIKKFDEYNHYIRMVIVLILHLLSSQGFDEPSINPPETSDVVTLFFNWTVKHEVQPWDSLVPHCASIVNFLSVRRHTTHITYFFNSKALWERPGLNHI